MPYRRRSRLALILLGGVCLSLAGSTRALAQLPQPTVPETAQRSGLIRRFVPMTPNLPPDPRRDNWYDTRWGDAPNLRKHPNFYKNGGLYGLPWPADHTKSYYPYFFGAPGPGTLRPESTPPKQFWRVASAIVKPFKPVGFYYDQGSHVPVYDLDPIVPGPGPMIWPFFPKITAVGG